MLVPALRVTKMDTGFSDEQQKIRDAFDGFFDFFDKLYAFPQLGLLKFDDYVYFNYWLGLVKHIE